jgi:hypothetical protein
MRRMTRISTSSIWLTRDKKSQPPSFSRASLRGFGRSSTRL